MTWGAFERLPDEEFEGCTLELLDGEVVRTPPAELRVRRVSMRIFGVLNGALGGSQSSGLCEVWHTAGYHIGDNWLVPDVSISRAVQAEGKYLEGAPALAVEVAAKTDTESTMHRQIRKYIENGSQEVWVFYPDSASVRVYSGKTAVEIEGQLTSDLLPGVSIDLAPIFA